MLSNFTQSIMQPLIDNLCAFFHIHVHLLLSFEKFMTNFTTDLYTFKISFKSPHNIMPKIFSSTIVDVHLGSQMLIKITMIEWDSTEKVISVFILLHIDWIKVVIMDHFIVLKRKIFITCPDFTSIIWWRVWYSSGKCHHCIRISNRRDFINTHSNPNAVFPWTLVSLLSLSLFSLVYNCTAFIWSLCLCHILLSVS